MHQCNALQDITANVEDFTFWYITLPPADRPKGDNRFQQALSHNSEVLASAFLGLQKSEATAILDDGIGRALKRAGREDLAESWKAHHDPALLAAVNPAENHGPATVTPVRPETAPPPSIEPQASPREAPAPAARTQAQKTQAAERQRRYARPLRYRSARVSRQPRQDEVEQNQREYTERNPPYPPNYSPSPYYYYSANPYQIPAAPQPQQQARPYQEPATQDAQAPSAQVSPYYGPGAQQPYYSPIAQQIDKNFRTIFGLINENVRTVQQVVFGTLGPPQYR